MAESAYSLGPISGGRSYTISSMVGGSAGPLVLDLLADGVAITPSSSVTPAPSDLGDWKELSRTYDPNTLGDHLGKPMKIVIGTRPPDLFGTRVVFDNVAMEVVCTDPDLPDVDAGVDIVTWSGQPVQLAPIVVNNDPNDPQGTLSYAWTAYPADGVVFDPAVNPADPNTSNVEAPTVTITKDTDNPSDVMLMLSVTLAGNVPVFDGMTIDVYDTPCLAIVGTYPDALDITDITADDCITNLKDFAVMAKTWLVDYIITAPVEKP